MSYCISPKWKNYSSINLPSITLSTVEVRNKWEEIQHTSALIAKLQTDLVALLQHNRGRKIQTQQLRVSVHFAIKDI